MGTLVVKGLIQALMFDTRDMGRSLAMSCTLCLVRCTQRRKLSNLSLVSVRLLPPFGTVAPLSCGYHSIPPFNEASFDVGFSGVYGLH